MKLGLYSCWMMCDELERAGIGCEQTYKQEGGGGSDWLKNKYRIPSCFTCKHSRLPKKHDFKEFSGFHVLFDIEHTILKLWINADIFWVGRLYTSGVETVWKDEGVAGRKERSRHITLINALSTIRVQISYIGFLIEQRLELTEKQEGLNITFFLTLAHFWFCNLNLHVRLINRGQNLFIFHPALG